MLTPSVGTNIPIVNIIGGSYQLDERNLSGQRSINWHMEEYASEDKNTKVTTALKPTPGGMLDQIMSSVTTDVCRGLYTSSSGPSPTYESRLYGVWGTTVYRFSPTLLPFVIGTVSANMEPVGMIDNGLDFVIVDGAKMYSYPLQNPDGLGNLIEVELPTGGGAIPATIIPTHVAFFKQRLIVNNRNANTWYYSKLGLTSFDCVNNLDFYSAEQNSDNILALTNVAGSLLICGPKSFEIWREGPGALDPFAYVGGSSSQIGILAPQSMATLDNMCFWLGASDVGHGMVYMLSGTTATRVSNMGLEDQLSKLTSPSRAIGWAYAEGGNYFYILSFPLDGRTWVYDQSIGMWHERLSFDPLTGLWGVYPYAYGVYINQRTYCGTLVGSALTYLDKDKCTEWNGNPIVRQRVCPVINDTMTAMSIEEFAIDGQVGTTTLLEGQGSDPVLIVEVSKDGGSTYGARRELSIGRQGNYRKQVRLRSLGRPKELVFRISLSDPVSYTMYQARLDYKLCGRS
jgi:hypothetical protein